MNLTRLSIVLFPLATLLAADGRTPLIDAAKHGDLAAVERLIQHAANVNEAEPDGSTALLYAAHRNDFAIAAVLLRVGAKANITNAYGVSALSEAAETGNAKLVQKLLEAGAEANSRAFEGEPVLSSAARGGYLDVMRLLIAAGAQVDARETWKGQTALMWAAAANQAEAVALLIKHGASIDARSTAVAPEVKHPANGNLVSEQPKGAMTALLFAAREGAKDAARTLVQAGANLNLADADGITPLIMAVINGHYDSAGVLIEAGADVNLTDAWGRGPLYAAVDMHSLEPSTTRPAPPGHDELDALEIVRRLLVKGAAPNARLAKATPGRGIPDGSDPLLVAGTTPFLRAAKTGDVAAMKLLLAQGADPTLTTKDGVNALMAAAGQGWRYGDSQIPEDAALDGVKLCIDLGLDVNAVNAKGDTALHGAADRGADKIVSYLAGHGARLGVKDQAGQTALEIARGGEARGHPGYPTTAALLEQLTLQSQPR